MMPPWGEGRRARDGNIYLPFTLPFRTLPLNLNSEHLNGPILRIPAPYPDPR